MPSTPRPMLCAALVITVLVLCLVPFFLLSLNLPLSMLAHAGHDDALYMGQAQSIANGDWLGTYNDRVLAKPPGFALFMAALHHLGINYQLGVALLQVIAVLVCATGLWRLTGALWPALISIPLLLFHPQVFSLGGRVLREAIYPSLIILFIGLLLISFRSRFRFSGFLLAGLVCGWAWITREDGIWMLPGLVVLFAVLASGWRSLPMMVLAFTLGAVLPSLSVGYLNQQTYGSWTVAEINDADFVDAVSRLASVENGGQKRGVGVTKATREAIYAVSPSFASLRPIMEAENYWTFGCVQRAKTCGEIANGWWHWALRSAANSAGYLSSPQTATSFYRSISAEVSAACDDGRLTCHWRPIKQLPTILAEDIPDMPVFFGQLILRAFLSGTPIMPASSSTGTPEQMEAMLALLNRPFAFQSADYHPAFLADLNAGSTPAMRFLNRLISAYKTTFYVLALAVVGLLAVGLFRRSIALRWPIAGVIVAIMVLNGGRMGLLSIIGVASFDTANLLYLGPVMQLTVLLLILAGFSFLPRPAVASDTRGILGPGSWFDSGMGAAARDIGLGVLIALLCAAVLTSINIPRKASGTFISDATMSGIREQSRLDPAIQGFIDLITVRDGMLRIQGWAADTANPVKPMDIMIFGDDQALGAAAPGVARPDVDAFLKLPAGPARGFDITTRRSCPPGAKIELMGISDDGRYAPLMVGTGVNPVCP